MPTADRRIFVPQGIKYFRSQDYKNKELVIVDDGVESVADLVPDDPQIRYIRLHGKRSLGAKRNECVEACRSDLIMHWDDDDWMAPYRISYQVEALLREDAEVCGLQRMLFYDIDRNEVWLYQYPDNQCPWLAGGSLLYTRDFWRRSPFPNIQVAS
ncbi:MAG TPA: glycosyltransferase family 2 protein, partial [Pyrinomonadaceae bacterium]